MKKILLTIGLTIGGLCSLTNAYFFGLKSADNTTRNIQQIEKQYNVHLPVVAFIFDPWNDGIIDTIKSFPKALGTGRIYHLTLSPNNFSAKQVAEGIFDKEYNAFFKAIKESDIKVIFRTMHEMNGGRYPRASNPTEFKKARIHVRNLARENGLDKTTILFDMSVNHWDMPTKETPSQKAKLIQCKQPYKKKVTKTVYQTVYEKINTLSSSFSMGLTTPTQYKKKIIEKQITEEVEVKPNCYRFEDYYPGDKYVDVIGFTFYNRGKATSNRLWLSPRKILDDPDWKTLERVKKIGKPIVIDEVGTTAVWYTGTYSNEASKKAYKTDFYRKNTWLGQLKTLLKEEPAIKVAVYFNVDYTNGLNFPTVGEADRPIIDLKQKKIYFGFRDLYSGAQQEIEKNSLFTFTTPKETREKAEKKTSINRSGLLQTRKKTLTNKEIYERLEGIKKRSKDKSLLQEIENIQTILN